MWGMMTENYQGKPKDLMEELGLETDEMVKVDVMGDFTKW